MNFLSKLFICIALVCSVIPSPAFVYADAVEYCFDYVHASDTGTSCYDNSSECDSQRQAYLDNTDQGEADSCTPHNIEEPEPISGCTDEVAVNFNINATLDDGSCIYDDIVDTEDPGGPATPPPGGPATPPPGGTSRPPIVLPKIPNPTAYGSLCDLINAVLNVVAEIAAIVAVLFIIFSGFLFVTAQGNPAKLEQAKKTFYTTIIGTAIIVGGSIITKIIINTVNAVSPSLGGSGNIICPKK